MLYKVESEPAVVGIYLHKILLILKGKSTCALDKSILLTFKTAPLILLFSLFIMKDDSIVIIVISSVIEKLFVMGITNEIMDISSSNCCPILYLAIHRCH